MPNKIDLTGKIFGGWRVLHQTAHQGRRIYYLCECACGNQKNVAGNQLSNGKSRSCGCLKGSAISASKITHGLSGTRLQTIHSHMLARCHNPQDEAFDDYGGRGITVCERWRTLNGFYDDVKNNYSDDLTIERIDVNGNYEPSNCCWIPASQQPWNTRASVRLQYNGINYTLPQLANKYNIKLELLRKRIARGWTIEKALFSPKEEKYDHPPIKKRY